MPYWPIAQVYGAFALPRGPNSFFSLGDAIEVPALVPRSTPPPMPTGYSMATPIVVPPGVYAGAPGSSPVDARIAQTMIVQSARGAGPAGTRGIVNFVKNSQVNRTTIVNRFSTPASAIDRTLSGDARTGPHVYELPGATRRRPGVKGAKWWAGSGIERRGYGNATVAPPGRTLSGLPHGLGDVTKWANSTSADADAWLAANGESQRAKFCNSGWKGSRGKDKDFQSWCQYWASKGTNTTSNTTYDAALAALTSFYNGLIAGTTPADAPLPSGVDTLADPGSGGAGKAAYDSIQSMLGRLDSARQAAKFRQYSAPVYTAPSTTAAPTTSNVNASGAVYVNASGQLVDANGILVPGYTGTSTTGRPGTFVPAGGTDPYGSDYAGATLTNAPPSTASIVPAAGGDSALVVNPDGTTTVQPTGDVAAPKGGKKGGSGALLVGALVLGLGAVAYARHRRKKA